MCVFSLAVSICFVLFSVSPHGSLADAPIRVPMLQELLQQSRVLERRLEEAIDARAQAVRVRCHFLFASLVSSPIC